MQVSCINNNFDLKFDDYKSFFESLKFLPPNFAFIFKQIFDANLEQSPLCFVIEFSSIAWVKTPNLISPNVLNAPIESIE